MNECKAAGYRTSSAVYDDAPRDYMVAVYQCMAFVIGAKITGFVASVD